MSIKNFSQFINEQEDWWGMPQKEVSTEWFNQAPDEEIKRFIDGFNDGQGDHSVYTYEMMVKLLQNSDRPGKRDLQEMTRMEILDEFFNDLYLNGNNSDTVYFDGAKYLKVSWI
jgi:hypothetical protein